jgi:toxin YoeB
VWGRASVVFALSGWASRRINEEHRLVYRVVDAHDQLEVLSCRYHYTDR